MRILFVCLGNICRSPMAEAVMRYWLKKERLEHLVEEAASVGTSGSHEGEYPDRRAQAAGSNRGYDLSSHKARRLHQSDFERYDLILAMDKENLETLKLACPLLYQNRLGLLLHFGPLAISEGREEVPDPYFGGVKGFERVLDMIEDGVGGLLLSLRDGQLGQHGTHPVPEDED